MSKGKLYVYVDKSGSTGINLFDDKQPFFWTAALLSQVDLQVQPSGNTEIASSIRNYRRYCNDRLFCRIDARLKLATFLI